MTGGGGNAREEQKAGHPLVRTPLHGCLFFPLLSFPPPSGNPGWPYAGYCAAANRLAGVSSPPTPPRVPHQVRDDGANAPFVLSSRPLPRFATVEDAARNVSTILACGLPHKKHPSPQGNVPCGEGLLWKKVACALFHHCFLHLVSHADYVYAGRQLDVARRAAIDYAAACVIDNGRGFRAQNVQHAIRAAYAEQVAGGRAQGGRVLQSEGGRKRNVLGYADGAPGVGVAVAPLHEHVAIVGGRLDVGFRAVVVYAITQHAAHVLAPVGHVERYDTFFRRPYGIERYGAVVFGGQVDDFLPVVVCFHADVVFGPSGKVAPCTCEVVRGQGLGDIVGERLRFHAALCLVGVRVEGYGIGVCCPAGIQVHVFRQYGFALYGLAAGFCGVPFGGVSCAFRHGQRDCGAVFPYRLSAVSRSCK